MEGDSLTLIVAEMPGKATATANATRDAGYKEKKRKKVKAPKKVKPFQKKTNNGRRRPRTLRAGKAGVSQRELQRKVYIIVSELFSC